MTPNWISLTYIFDSDIVFFFFFLKYMELRNVNRLDTCKHLVLTAEQQFVASLCIITLYI